MTALEWKRIRIDWEELLDAFEDASTDHRYYLDRETGAVHFFSAYLDNEDDEDEERAVTAGQRYVQIPPARETVPTEELAEFVATLQEGSDRRVLTTALRAPDGYKYFREAIESLPSARKQWLQFSNETVKTRIEAWLSEVSVEPL
jgi:hypothetical protein